MICIASSKNVVHNCLFSFVDIVCGFKQGILKSVNNETDPFWYKLANTGKTKC